MKPNKSGADLASHQIQYHSNWKTGTRKSFIVEVGTQCDDVEDELDRDYNLKKLKKKVLTCIFQGKVNNSISSLTVSLSTGEISLELSIERL